MAISKPRSVQGIDQGLIHLQERFAAGANDEPSASRSPSPANAAAMASASATACCKAAAARAVGADEIGVAEIANGGGAILFMARPEIAAGKAAKHRGPTGIGAFALQGVEDLFDRVIHASIITGCTISPAITRSVGINAPKTPFCSGWAMGNPFSFSQVSKNASNLPACRFLEVGLELLRRDPLAAESHAEVVHRLVEQLRHRLPSAVRAAAKRPCWRPPGTNLSFVVLALRSARETSSLALACRVLRTAATDLSSCSRAVSGVSRPS